MCTGYYGLKGIYSHVVGLYIYALMYMSIYRVFFKSIDKFTALRFTTTGGPPAARRRRILQMNQPIPFEMNYNSQITGGVENAVLSTRRNFAINCFVKKIQVQKSFLHLQHLDTNFHWMVLAIVLPFLHQNLTLHSPELDVSVVFYGVCSSLALMSCNLSVSTRRLCICFLSIKSPVVLSLFTRLWVVCWELIHHEIYVEIFAYTFQQIRISRSCHREIHTALKYTAPWHTTLLANCNSANGAGNCCLLLTNQTLPHEPHCSPCNIIPSSCPHINYFPSFQTLSGDSSTKFVCASRQTAHPPLWSAEP
jgi:hypothetical protein